jgi:VWFA-related protein
MGDVLLKARTTETMIYAIGLESEFAIGPGRMQRTRPDRGLRKLADETGGGYFELKKTADLAPTFTRVAAELHSLYTIGFTPTAFDNKEHKLEVNLKTQDQTARARKSYIASAERLSGTK